jgi:hypothetical protein
MQLRGDSNLVAYCAPFASTESGHQNVAATASAVGTTQPDSFAHRRAMADNTAGDTHENSSGSRLNVPITGLCPSGLIEFV